MGISVLWKDPLVNPINQKARTIPALNPFNKYGRVFFFSWFGFLIAFWSWYAFPPLLHDVIAQDLGMTSVDVANSNIVALCATLAVRLVAGPSCDRFGPRWTFAMLLLAGAVPTFLAGAVYNKHGLLALRFFVGILGGSFVPCQVWTTGFFDKNVVGTANALTGGFGNAGGGITYFVMPAVYESLVYTQGLTPHVAWRVTFIVPGILIVATAVAMLLFTDDCPTGKWAEREQAAQQNLRRHSITTGIVEIPGELSNVRTNEGNVDGSQSPSSDDEKKKETTVKPAFDENEAQMGVQQMLDTAQGEVIRKPTFREGIRVCFSPQTITTAAGYFCSFGGELAINSVLGTYYSTRFPAKGFQENANWAAMFGLLNVAFRPLGGVVSDLAYNYTGRSVWAKKILLHVYAFITGVFLIIIGVIRPNQHSMLVGLVAGMAFFMESGNGLNFGLVPHVHPHANGVVSGFTGAAGNLGGIVFAIVFRYNPRNWEKSFWITGVMTIALNAAVCWIPPIPKGQIGGR